MSFRREQQHGSGSGESERLAGGGSAARAGYAPSSGSDVNTTEAHAAYLTRTTEIVLRELEQLPTLPSVATRLLQLGADDEVDIREISKIIETDPALTIKLLSLCKRASTRTRVPVTTVETAVVMLGLDAVRALVLSVEIFEWSNRLRVSEESGTPGSGHSAGHGTGRARARKTSTPGVLGSSAGTSGWQESLPIKGGFDPTRLEPVGYSRGGFWQHSIAVACAADLITREHPHLEFRPEEAFVCGLVHDVGKLALEWVLPKAYARVTDLAAQHQANISDFEQAVLGLDHCKAGARLAHRWGLPRLIVDAIALHHSPGAWAPRAASEPPQRTSLERLASPAAGVVSVADMLCRRLALGWSGNHLLPVSERAMCEQAGLNIERVEGVIVKLYEHTAARCKELGLGEEPSQQLLIDSVLRANARLGRLSNELCDTNARLESMTSKLAEARSLTRLGQMTAGAAHEMNSPLAIMSGRAQWLLPRLRDDKDKQAGQSILDAVGRLTHLITRLNRIACPGTMNPDTLDAGAMLSDAISKARAKHTQRMEAAGIATPMIGIKLVVEEHLPLASLDREMLTDAMLEIIGNALESYPKQSVRVSASQDEADGALILRVQDDGVGMSQTTLAHATDPFYSDKPAGRQTGLGLALADRLIRLHGGELVLTSTEGKGTDVSVRLPMWRAEKPRGIAARSAA